MQKGFVRKFITALAFYVLFASILAVLHDYPQSFGILETSRHDKETAKRQRWLSLLYFLNEAGSGIKFLFTGNERYMVYYPSPSHIVANRLAHAQKGNWRAQLKLGKMYLSGEFVPVDIQESLTWLQLAKNNAPATEAKKIAQLLHQAEMRLPQQKP